MFSHAEIDFAHFPNSSIILPFQFFDRPLQYGKTSWKASWNKICVLPDLYHMGLFQNKWFSLKIFGLCRVLRCIWRLLKLYVIWFHKCSFSEHMISLRIWKLPITFCDSKCPNAIVWQSRQWKETKIQSLCIWLFY